MSEIFETLVAVGKLAGFFAVLGALKLWVYNPLRSLYDFGVSHFAKVEKNIQEVTEIRSELSRNGGNSTKDAVAEIREAVNMMNERARIMMDDDERGRFETNANGECIFVNKSYARLVGRSANECLGFAWKSIVHEEDRQLVTEEWLSCVKEGREFGMQYRYVTPDEKILLVQVRALPMRVGKDRKCAGHVGHVTLINEDDPRKTKRHRL